MDTFNCRLHQSILYDLSPVLTYVLGVLVDPFMAGSIVAGAMLLGTSYKVITMGFPIVYVPGATLVRGLEALLTRARLGKPKEKISGVTRWEIFTLVIEVFFETFGFFVLDWYLFGWAIALTVLPTIVDAVFIPLASGARAYTKQNANIQTILINSQIKLMC